MAVTLEEIEEFLRQPAPRRIPTNIRERLVSSGSLLISLILGGAFLGFGSLLCLLFFPWNFPSELMLDFAQSSQTEAWVTKVEDTNMSVNNRRVKRVSYEFITRQEQKLQGVSYFTWNIPAVDSRCKVDYRAGDPRLNRLEGGKLNPTGYLGSLVAIFPAVGMVFVLATLGYRRSKLRILRDGEFALAQIQTIEATNVTVNNQRRFKISLDLPSQKAMGTLTLYGYGPEVDLARQRMDSSELLGVLYDPAKPSRLMMIDSLLSQ